MYLFRIIVYRSYSFSFGVVFINIFSMRIIYYIILNLLVLYKTFKSTTINTLLFIIVICYLYLFRFFYYIYYVYMYL